MADGRWPKWLRPLSSHTWPPPHPTTHPAWPNVPQPSLTLLCLLASPPPLLLGLCSDASPVCGGGKTLLSICHESMVVKTLNPVAYSVNNPLHIEFNLLSRNIFLGNCYLVFGSFSTSCGWKSNPAICKIHVESDTLGLWRKQKLWHFGKLGSGEKFVQIQTILSPKQKVAQLQTILSPKWKICAETNHSLPRSDLLASSLPLHPSHFPLSISQFSHIFN